LLAWNRRSRFTKLVDGWGLWLMQALVDFSSADMAKRWQVVLWGPLMIAGGGLIINWVSDGS